MLWKLCVDSRSSSCKQVCNDSHFCWQCKCWRVLYKATIKHGTLPSSASFYYFIRTWSLQGLTRTTESVKEERDYGWWSLYRLKHFGGLTILLFLLVHVFLTSDRSNSCQQWSQHSDYAEQWPVLLVKTILDIKVGVNVIQCDFLPSVYHLDYVHGRLRLQK